MKQFLMLLLMLSSFSPAAAQKEYKRRPGPFLIFGPVHIIREERAKIINKDGESVEEARVPSALWTYNEDGTKQEVIRYEADGSVMHKTVDTYDPDGRILETISLDGKDVMVSRKVSVYDDQKKLKEEISYRGNGTVSSKTTFARLGQQMTSESVSFDDNGVVVSRLAANIDLRGHRADAIISNKDRTVRTESSIINNPDGGWVTESQSEDKPVRRKASVPDGKGGEERTDYNPDGTVRSKERITREFDSYGNLIKEFRSVAKGPAGKYEPVSVMYRTIEYY
jgi:antitoxin component YwqK of YwqJK toxin-antitoxin module